MAQLRIFFIVCVGVMVLMIAAIAASIAPPRDLPPAVAAGYGHWQAQGCAGCHTLYGQGGNFAPDLTHIYAQRGENYLREFFVNPNAFHPDQRVMPRLGLTRSETDEILAFLDWAGQLEAAQSWPPRDLAVAGMGGLNAAAIPSENTASSGASGVSGEDDARGRLIFSQRCASCHSLTPDSAGLPGPSLYRIADRAGTRVSGQNAETYIRTSILDPSEYLVEGYADVMQKNFGDVLSSDDLNALIAFLMGQTAETGGSNES